MAQTASSVYWQFNPPNPLVAAIGGAAYTISPGNAPYTIGVGPVGNFMSHDLATNTTNMSGGNLALTNQLSVQFIFRPGRNFQKMVNGVYDGFATVLIVGGTNFVFQYPYLIITTNLGGQQFFELNGTGAASWANIQDGLFHMISYTINGTTGVRRLYIDGQSPTAFITNGPTGSVTGGPIEFVNNGNTPRQYAGDIDEVALYTTAINANQVWQNYVDFKAGNHYTTAFAPSIPPYTASFTGTYNTLEYGAGYAADSLVDAQPIAQLQASPTPMLKPIYIGADSLHDVLGFDDIYWLGQSGQSGVTNAQAVLNGVEIEKYLATYFGHALFLGQMGPADPADTNTLPGKIVKINNLFPNLKLAGNTFLAQSPNPHIPFDSYDYVNDPRMPLGFYLQNSSACPINENGVPCPTCPTFPAAGPTGGIGPQGRPGRNQANTYPYNGLGIPGAYWRSVVAPINAALTGGNKLDYLTENEEVVKLYPDNVMALDPLVNADRIASGMTPRGYQSAWKYNIEKLYFDTMNLGVCTKIAYQFQANPTYWHEWGWMKLNLTPYHSKHVQHDDIYPIRPGVWWSGAAANHGLVWRRDNIKIAFSEGDSLAMPFVSPGWFQPETNNMAPPQYLGLLKYLATAGSESFIAATFSNVGGLGYIINPRNYICNVYLMPAYAHGIATRLERFYDYGKLLPGDLINHPVSDPTSPAWQVNTGDFRTPCVVRKLDSGNIYAIGTTLQRNNNLIGNTEDSVVRSIDLSGETIYMTIRQQGSVYIYDNSTPSAKVFYQLDGWHENTHPTRWSSDFILQAEVNDNYDPQQPVALKTDLRGGAVSSTDFVNATTYVSYPTSVLDSVRFNIIPTVSDTFFIWVRLKSKNGAATSIKYQIDGGTAVTLPVSNTAWYFYRYNNGTGSPVYKIMTAGTAYHIAFLCTDINAEVDQIILTKNGSAVYPETTSPCIATSTITPSGATSFCSGDSVTLTANVNISYLWNTGATTISIKSYTSGIYTVTVTDGLGCTGVSSPTTVTVSTSPPVPVITPSGSTTFCSGASVNLTATAATSWLWSTGATTQTINVTTAAVFTVTVTNAGGCTKSSASTTTTVSALPGVPTITPTGATTFCSGSTVLLTGTAATSYLWSTGAITQAITTGTAGTYTITVTNAAGCTRSSAGTAVTVLIPPIIAFIPPTQNACPDTSVDVSALSFTNTGTAYISNVVYNSYNQAVNETLPITPVRTSSGVIYMRFTAANGCYDIKTIDITIVSCSCASPPAANAGADATICAGSTKVLAGSITNASIGTWASTGTGAFTPSTTTLAATYTPSAADTVAGSVRLYLTTNNPLGAPCAVNVDSMILTISSRPTSVITASGSVTLCQGTSVNLVATANTSYLWSTGATTQSVTTSSAGGYTVTCTNSSGCTKVSSTTTVVVNPVPVVIIIPSSTTTLCTGGSVTLNATGGAAYAWSTGATTQSITTSLAGAYRVTVTNVYGCTGSSALTTVTVNAIPPTPSITASGPLSFCNGGNVTLMAPAGYTYSWSNGATTQNILVTTSATFTVTVSTGSCSSTSNVPVTTTAVGTGSTPTINPVNPIFICFGQNIELVVTPSSTYLWSTGETTQNIVVNTTGSYICTVTNTGGCTSVASPAVVQAGSSLKPVITATGATTFCSGDSVLLSCNSATSYLWSNGRTSQTIYAKINGTYTVTVTDAYGCTKSSASKVITVKTTPAVPVITPSGNLTFCDSGSVALVAPTSYKYLWSNNSKGKTITVRVSGTYTVTVYNDIGCSATSAPISTVRNMSCTAHCGVPFGLTITDIQKKQFTLNWDQECNNDSYKVYTQKTIVGSKVRGPESYPADTRSCNVFDLKNNTSYYVWMRGVCNGVNTDSTGAIIVKTLP